MEPTSIRPEDALASRAISELLHEVDPGAFAPHFQHPSQLVEADVPSPLAAAQAARALLAALRRKIVQHGLEARGAGESWEDVANALELTCNGVADEAAAYLTVLGVRGISPRWSPAWGVLWTCGSCGEAVRDYGPEYGGPDDRETGHASTCARHCADVRDWKELWA